MEKNKKNEKKDLKYFSTDKLYNIKHKKHLSGRLMSYVLLAAATIILLFSVYLFSKCVNLEKKSSKVEYGESGYADYTVYLKDNKYYETKFLPSGMQYLANLISTINTKFNYEIKADEDLDYSYTYDIVGAVQIVDSSDENKVIFSKDYTLLKSKTGTVKSNNVIINEDVDIDYDKYNNYVNAYKSEYGLSANSRLVVTMNIQANGKTKKADDTLSKNNKLQITIPLSQQTLDIKINTQNIDSKDTLKSANNSFITSIPMFIAMVGLFGTGVLLVILSVKFHKVYVKENIYTITVNKILKEYDRLIVNGNITIEEKTFDNKIQVDSFNELVDASQNLNAPILFYNVIPGEKCFFVIIKGNSLYKYRLTKAYLEREEHDKKNKKQI